MKILLHQLDKSLKNFLFVFTIVLATGVLTGLIYLNETTKLSPKGSIERWKGSDVNESDELGVPEQYPKSASEMLMTTHNHIIGFSMIYLMIGLIFYFNTTVTGFWKSFLMIEPLISVLVTFLSIWAVRYLNSGFIFITVISAVLMYACFFTMTGVILYELKIKRSD